jgi:hypothetical protein
VLNNFSGSFSGGLGGSLGSTASTQTFTPMANPSTRIVHVAAGPTPTSGNVIPVTALVSSPALASPAFQVGLTSPVTGTPPADLSGAAPGGPAHAAADGTSGGAQAPAAQHTNTPAGASLRVRTAARGLTLVQEAHLMVAGFDG